MQKKRKIGWKLTNPLDGVAVQEAEVTVVSNEWE